jgi:hypothetical protein
VYLADGYGCEHHGGVVQCSRTEFAKRLRAAKIATLPVAYRAKKIGGWIVPGHPGVWMYFGPVTVTSQTAGVIARVGLRCVAFTRDTEREAEILAAFRK